MQPGDSAFAASLAGLLPGWLRRQGWLARSSSTLLGAEVIETDTIVRDPAIAWVDIRVLFGGDVVDRYRLILAVRTEIPEGLDPDAVIGEIERDGLTLVVFEAMAWRAGVISVVRALMPEVVDGTVGADAVRLGTWGGVSPVAFIDGRWEVKAHRQLSDLPNPDVELPAALARAELGRVAPVAERYTRGGQVSLTLRPALRTRMDGLDLVTSSLQELFERRVPPRQARNDVAAEVEEIGRGTAELHVALGVAMGHEAGDGAAWSELLLAPLYRLGSGRIRFDRLEGVLGRLVGAEDLGRGIRTHGNLHLGNLAHTTSGWVPHNFEGDGRPFDELNATISPLRDLARLVVSMGRAARTMTEHFLEGDPERDRELEVLSEAWEDRVVGHLVSGYTSVDDVHPLLPASREARDALLRIFELEHQLTHVMPDTHETPWMRSGGASR
ncbi:MAG: hypothetical protein R2754_01220 [Microthrixaceae bacterium]